MTETQKEVEYPDGNFSVGSCVICHQNIVGAMGYIMRSSGLICWSPECRRIHKTLTMKNSRPARQL